MLQLAQSFVAGFPATAWPVSRRQIPYYLNPPLESFALVAQLNPPAVPAIELVVRACGNIRKRAIEGGGWRE
jgi:hypothetical protein